jgi:hypothetical protein
MKSFILILISFCLVHRVLGQSSTPAPDDSVHFPALLPYQVNGINEFGSGSYALWYKTGNGPTNQITRPLILFEGIDFL